MKGNFVREENFLNEISFICTSHLGARAVESSNGAGEEVVGKVASKL